MNLKNFFKENNRIALAFSGGVDSAYLLYAALNYGADIQPYYIKTPFQPEFEYKDALKLSQTLNVTLKMIEYDILNNKEVSSNPQNRCYYCKTAIFSLIKEEAKKDGYRIVIDGTNASDNINDRPGMIAIKELSVKSPLRECGLTKEKIRELSKEAGLFTWNKPAYACLATRIPCGAVITANILDKIEKSENILFNMGFSDFRIRIFNGAARLQLPENQLYNAVNNRVEIIRLIKPYFKNIFLDLETR